MEFSDPARSASDKLSECLHLLGLDPCSAMSEIRQTYKKLLRENKEEGNEERSKSVTMAYNYIKEQYHLQHEVKFISEDGDVENSDVDSNGFDKYASDSDPSSSASSSYLEKFEKWKIDFHEMQFKNNFYYHCAHFASETERILEKKLNLTKNFFCSHCDKYFVNFRHHYDKVIGPYYDMLMIPFLRDSVRRIHNLDSLHREIPFEAQMGKLFGKLWTEDFTKFKPPSLKFYEDEANWTKVRLIINNVPKYISKIDQHKIHTYAPYIDNDFELVTIEKVPFPAIFHQYVDFSQFRINRKDYEEEPRIKVSLELNHYSSASIDPKFIPSFILETSPKKNMNHTYFCHICRKQPPILPKLFKFCKVCSNPVCSSLDCSVKRPILHMGINERKKVCKFCISICQEKISQAWIKAAAKCYASTEGKLETVERYLKISYLYLKDFKTLPVSVITLYKELAAVALQRRNFSLVLMIKEFERTSNFSWGYIAFQIAEHGKEGIPYALACLEKIAASGSCNLQLQNWITLGDYLASKGDPHLVAYCYNHARLTSSNWIVKAEDFIQHMDYISQRIGIQCLTVGIQGVESKENLIKTLFTREQYGIALYAMKILEFEAVDFFTHHFDLENNLVSMILIIDYFMKLHPRKHLHFDEKSGFSCLAQLMKPSPQMFNGVADIIRNIEASPLNMEAILPKLFKLKLLKGKEKWKQLSYQAVTMKHFNAALVLMKLCEIEDSTYDPSLWYYLGKRIKDQNGDKEFQMVCHCLPRGSAGQGRINELVELGYHEIVIKICIQQRIPDLLQKLGLEHYDRSDFQTGSLYFCQYLKYILFNPSSNSDDIAKVSKTLKILEILVPNSNLPTSLLLETKRSLIQKFANLFFHPVSYPIHRSILCDLMTISNGFVNVYIIQAFLAGIHLLPSNAEFNGETYANLLDQFVIKTLDNAFACNDLSLMTKIIPYIKKHCIPAIQNFITFHLNGRNIQEIDSSVLVSMLLILEGLIEKLKGNRSKAMNFFEKAIDKAFTPIRFEVTSSVASIFVDDFKFHEDIFLDMQAEMVELGENCENNILKSLPIFLPEILHQPDDDYFADDFVNVDVELMKNFENSSSLNQDCLETGFQQINLCSSFEGGENSVSGMISLFSSAKIFTRIALNGAALPELYALRNLVFDLCSKIIENVSGKYPPYLELYFARFALSMLVKANHAFCCALPDLDPSISRKPNQEVVFLEQQHFMSKLRDIILTLGNIQPFSTSEILPGSQLRCRNANQMVFLQIYSKEKCMEKYCSIILPNHYFNFLRVFMAKQGWISSSLYQRELREAITEYYKWKRGELYAAETMTSVGIKMMREYAAVYGLKEGLTVAQVQKLIETPKISIPKTAEVSFLRSVLTLVKTEEMRVRTVAATRERVLREGTRITTHHRYAIRMLPA